MGPRVSGGTTAENARIVIGYARCVHCGGIPVPRTSQLPTNPILAAPAGRLLTGVYQQDSSSKPPPAPLASPRRSANDEHLHARFGCLTIIQSYQRLAFCCERSNRTRPRSGRHQ